ncbi:MAG: class I SAM-dependent methyltransferase, partial [Deltaproteobacteria bacterium]|nr:class I SAM-dependent methyltransferase [Deltaproteobacteria bacterium]
RLERGATIYDVGCGGGLMTVMLANKFPASRFIGIDVLPTAIAVARQEATKSSTKNVEFQLMNANELPPDSADCIILNEVLHEIQMSERSSALKAIYDALRPGGLLFLVDVLVPENIFDYSQSEYVPGALCDFFEAPWGSKILTRPEFEKLIPQAGFSSPEYLECSDSLVVAYFLK